MRSETATWPAAIESASKAPSRHWTLREANPVVVYSVLAFSLLIAILVGLTVGASAVGLHDVLYSVAVKLGLATTDETLATSVILWEIRMPRVLLGALVGAALSVSGAALQGLFRNPLADPGLVGVANGAALGAVLAIVLLSGLSLAWLPNHLVVPICAFLGGLLAAALVYLIGSHGGQINTALILLAGIAIAACCGAATGLLIYWADDDQLRSVTFWMLGSLAHGSWREILFGGLLLICPIILITRCAAGLNALALGEEDARALGINVTALKKGVLVLAASLVGVAVAFTGIIGFVGLVVPHLLRLAFGADYRFLLPASALLGASLLVFADSLARVIVAPAELPVGIVTSMLGSPFFIWLLLRQRSQIQPL